MSKLVIAKSEGTKPEKEFLKISFSHRKVDAGMHVISFIDKDTKHHVFYAPSIEVSAYGETSEEAAEMMSQAIKDCFKHLLSLGQEGVNKELEKLGWDHDTLFEKEYSKVYVNFKGELQEFNAEEHSIKHHMLTTAAA